MLNTVPDPENYLTYFIKIDNTKFRDMVVPGDTLLFHLELISPIRRGICHMRGKAFVGDKVVMESEMMAQIVRRDKKKMNRPTNEATAIEPKPMQALNWIHPEAKIGKDVKIDPFTVIHEDVEIGEGTWIGSNVTIFPGARIGKHVRIFPGAVISAVPQDLKFAGEKTTAEIGDHTTIREYVTINRGTTAAGKTVVGAHNLLMAYVHIAHDCFVGDHCILANGVTLAGHIEIHDYAIIGGLSAIHQFVQIGSHVMISGGSLVRKDVPPFVKAAHEPSRMSG